MVVLFSLTLVVAEDLPVKLLSTLLMKEAGRRGDKLETDGLWYKDMTLSEL